MENMSRCLSVRLLVATVVAVLALSGCARKSKTETGAMTESPPSSAGGTVTVQKIGDGSKRYFRDTQGRLYYVDPQGALHVIEKTVAIESGGGLYYIIEDDSIDYRRDSQGRIHYVDPQGRVVFIEESGPGQVIDPLPILRGSELRSRMESGRSVSYCESEWKKCLDKCDKVSGSLNKKNCFENCDFQKTQCSKPY